MNDSITLPRKTLDTWLARLDDAQMPHANSKVEAVINQIAAALAAPQPEPQPADLYKKCCPGIPAVGCNYTATCNQVCSKCGNVHQSSKLNPIAQPVQPTSADYAMGYAEGFNDGCKPVPGTRAAKAIKERTS